jgi:hypothetical protein
VYVIASEVGLEIGFSVTIHEDDYYNATVKQKQRNIVPVLNRKLPQPTSNFVADLDAALSGDGVWKFGTKTRQRSNPEFASLAKLIEFLKSPNSSLQGGGAVYRIVEPDEVSSPQFYLDPTFSQALERFASLMRLLVPSRAEDIRLKDQEAVDEAANELPDFNPANTEDGRKKTLHLVAIRQGQEKFREKLFEAYKGSCAVTGTVFAP